MNYYLDTEFLEGFHKPLFGKSRHFIDLISIGMVCEDGREYYAISSEVDVDKIWNNKDTFVLENVVKPMFLQYVKDDWNRFKYFPGYTGIDSNLTKSNLKRFFKSAGRSNKQIAIDIKNFVYPTGEETGLKYSEWVDKYGVGKQEFYAYYADYDWVVFCSLFGRMVDLPKGFPMYCRDLKQTYDDKNVFTSNSTGNKDDLKSWPCYPKQFNEHNALDDAKWNMALHKFLLEI